jgi:hypothetical protein
MMADIPYVCLYARYLQTLAPFSDEERGRIMTAMLIYSTTGESPAFDGNERFIWPTIQAQIDRDAAAYQEKCEKNRANGAKGGRPPKNQMVIPETERFLEKPKKANTKTNRNTKSNDMEADKPPNRHKFFSPTVDEVKKYCQEQGYSVDAERFVDHYESNGWMVGRTKMKDWKAAVRNWSRKEKTNNGKNESQPIWSVGTEV